MRGRLLLSSLSRIKEYDVNKENIYIITRSNKQEGYIKQRGWNYTPELAPNKNLFFKVLKAKEQGKWNRSAFNDWYVKSYVNQINTDIETREKIIEIRNKLDTGINILLACYCGDYTMCHRMILGWAYENSGYKVIYG